jgi:hypothetical protein
MTFFFIFAVGMIGSLDGTDGLKGCVSGEALLNVDIVTEQ